MKTRQLGTSGLEVSELGLGCMGLSHEGERYPTSMAGLQGARQVIKINIR